MFGIYKQVRTYLCLILFKGELTLNRKNIYNNDCPILYTLNIIGGKWRIPILCQLSNGSLRYNQLKRQLPGITNIMLTRSLQDLEECKLIKRIDFSDIQMHVEYFLTEDAKKLVPGIRLLREWGKDQLLSKENLTVRCETGECI